ncbi:MAG: Rid family detoxifying hydrolase [Mucilaginibacter sp.]
MKTALFVCLLTVIFSVQATKAQTHQMDVKQRSEKTVKEFLEIVRAGKAPERAAEFMADTVIAHQMNAEKPEAIKRTPQNYADHIKEFHTLYGGYSFEITELIADSNKVYARWKQTGKHLSDIDQYKATGLPLIEVGSAVYRVENDKIVEYWIQLDRQGLDLQLQQNAKVAADSNVSKLPFTEAITSGESVYISGQIGINDLTGQLVSTDFKAEADRVMKNIGNVLKKNGLTYHDLVNVTIYLTTMENYAATNEVYRKYFNEHFPARVCIAVYELPLHAHIEIAAVARKRSR